ncbi:hypothetical protein FSP39_022070, partial [Pinctada imbricata]
YVPADCTDIQKHSIKTSHKTPTSGVYRIYPAVGKGHKANCDFITDGGGWTVFQKRYDGSVDFYRTWKEYQDGFGRLNGEHWLGNQILHEITARGNYELRIDLKDFDDNTRYAKYSSFKIGSRDEGYNLSLGSYSGTAGNQILHEVTAHGHYELRIDLKDFDGNTRYAKYSSFKIGSRDEGYKLSLGSYSGTAGDSLSYNNGMKFSTKDNDLDQHSKNCASQGLGAWWFKDLKIVRNSQPQSENNANAPNPRPNSTEPRYVGLNMVDLKDFDDNTRYAKYSSFKIGSRDEDYNLSLGSFSGTAGNTIEDG